MDLSILAVPGIAVVLGLMFYAFVIRPHRADTVRTEIAALIQELPSSAPGGGTILDLEVAMRLGALYRRHPRRVTEGFTAITSRLESEVESASSRLNMERQSIGTVRSYANIYEHNLDDAMRKLRMHEHCKSLFDDFMNANHTVS